MMDILVDHIDRYEQLSNWEELLANMIILNQTFIL